MHGMKRKPVSGSAPPRPIRVFFSHHVIFRIRSLTYYVTNNVRSVSIMYGSLRRRLRYEKNKMADNVHVAMESSEDQFVLRLYND